MNEFGKWLGKSNGDAMLASVLVEDITEEQARAAITNYCIIFGITVDTNEWDELIDRTYNYYNCWFDTKDEFDNYMAALLV